MTNRTQTLGTLRIDRRFNGPPDSGNGGYVCGEMAKALDTTSPGSLASGVRVRLRQPPPLDQQLEISATEEGCGLFEGDTLIAQACPEPLSLETPESIAVDVAARAALGFRGHQEHVFPGCFVCGPERAVGDGLRVFPGPVTNGETSMKDVFAASWQPDPSLAEGSIHAEGSLLAESSRSPAEGSAFVDTAFLWAALDCPGCFSFPQPEGAIVLLGEMTAAIPGRVRIDEPSVLLSWQISHQGRKHSTGTAIFDADGHCQGTARAMWIEIPA